jgi:hypothetical protein
MRFLAACLAVAAATLAARADSYNLTLTNASTATWSFSVNAPFITSGDPRTYIIGSYDATTNPTGTRTLTGLIGDNGLNNPISVTAGGITASGNSGGNPLHPAGGMALSLNPGANAVTASGLAIDLLNGSTITFGVSVSITYATFRERNPTCTLLGGFPISVPLGDAAITQLTVSQGEESAVGVLTPSGPNQYTFTIPMTTTVTVTATFGGAPFPVDPQTVPIVVNGTITTNGDTASVTATIDLSNQQTQPGPITMDPVAFDEPLCSGHLLLPVALSQVAVNLSSTVSIAAAGPRTCTSAAVTSSPGNLTVDEGQPASFTVGAAGSTPLSYQWRRGTTVLLNGGAISGANGPTLRINPATQADGGAYTCTVSNACASAVSGAATLTVNPAAGCDGDYNQDGNVDQDDVAYLVNVIAGGANPSGRDPDFTRDGNVDQEDYVALVNVIAGGPCP